MGNSSKKASSLTKPSLDERLLKLFDKLCKYELLDQELFLEHFKSDDNKGKNNVGSYLFNWYFIDLLKASPISRKIFAERAQTILDYVYKSQNEKINLYFDILTNNQSDFNEEDLTLVFEDCCKYGILLAMDSCVILKEDVLICSMVESCLNGATCVSKKNVKSFLIDESFYIFAGFEAWLFEKFTGSPLKTNFEMLLLPTECESGNTMLTPTLLYFLCTRLPTCYIRMDNKFNDINKDAENEKFSWNLLYESNQHGLSLNRFKSKLMNYKSATITILKFVSGVVLILALDEPWRDGPDKYGGPYCQLIEVSPNLKVLETNSSMVYLKENSRSISTGLHIGCDTNSKVKIDKDLQCAELNYRNSVNEVLTRVETWGCGGVKAKRNQEDLKKWELNEIEKRKKVKLPGEWDTDKAILEMGGVCVSHSQR
ncbi:uncharacterized protein LOC100202453 isoform X3 [Hydra vulgaris]|uniref:Uncharacterized protein LOC100202453 isoform X3 n=1 Tax=Hydra vulgaris TaxID=6087 RepID=A0ABM4CI46_HYDVU